MAKEEILHWQTDDVLKIADFDALYKKLEDQLPRIDQWYDKLTPDMSTTDYVAMEDFFEALEVDFARLGCLPALLESVDQKSKRAKQLKSRARDLTVRYSEAARKVSLWLKGIELEGKTRLDDKNAARLFAATPDLEYSSNYARQLARYSLSESEENIITNKDANGLSVLTDLRSLIESEFDFKLELPGQKPKIYQTSSELMANVYSPDLKTRQATYHALYVPYQENIDKFHMIYQAVVKNWAYIAKLRGYPSSIAMRNAANHIPDRAIEVLMQVCRDNRQIFQDYFKFKAGQLGMKKLTRFDIYAPLQSQDEVMSFSEAKAMVADVFENFSPDFAAKAQLILDQKHVDSHPAPAKRGGAYCMTVAPSITPYVMLNYAGRLRDVSTLAHELGHGVHSLYANHLPASVQHANLPLAETASTLAEMILFEKMLEVAKDDKTKKSMLSDKMGDSYATIMRQTYFVDFEITAHRRMSEGLTPDDLSAIWLGTLCEQFGDAVEVDKIFGNEWAYIPHIVHTPFYCYAYNFGELLSLALYARYKAEGKKFVPKIEQLLAAGGSKDPDKLLKSVGVDMSDAAFWQGSFEIIKSWQKQLEGL